MNNYQSIVEKNKDTYLQELIELLKFPSISADPAYKVDVMSCAQFVSDKMNALGLDKVEIISTKGYPVVYGEKIIDPSKPTILAYGHYDVQPADPIELWTSPPFQPVIKDGKIFARGSADDKGQFYMHFKALEILLSENKLNCNVKCII